MVRKSLKELYNKEQNKPNTYTGRLCDVGLARHRGTYKVLVHDVYLACGEYVADHLWLSFEVLP